MRREALLSGRKSSNRAGFRREVYSFGGAVTKSAPELSAEKTIIA
jgi:hypothetical protein